jgi:hypothetical protein
MFRDFLLNCHLFGALSLKLELLLLPWDRAEVIYKGLGLAHLG